MQRSPSFTERAPLRATGQDSSPRAPEHLRSELSYLFQISKCAYGGRVHGLWTFFMHQLQELLLQVLDLLRREKGTLTDSPMEA